MDIPPSMPAAITPAAILNLILEQQIVEPTDPIDEQADLFAEGLDSTAMMQLLLHVEDHFHIAIQPGDMRRERFATATALAAFLNEKRTAQAGK